MMVEVFAEVSPLVHHVPPLQDIVTKTMHDSTPNDVSISSQCVDSVSRKLLTEMPVLLRALSHKRMYATFPSPSQIASEKIATITKYPQKDMNAFTGTSSTELILPDESSNATLKYPIRVDIAVRYPCHYRGEVIAASVPLQPLEETTPTLLQYLTIDGAQILLPRSEAVDRTLLLNLIDLIVDKHCSGEVFEIDTHELLEDPLKSIKLHVIFKLFGLDGQAASLLQQLWLEFETHTLTLKDVFWIYGALISPEGAKWTPGLTRVYLQMIGWNILNADAEGRLHADLCTFFLKEEGHPYHLTHFLKEHWVKYRLGREELITIGAASRPRRDTIIECIEAVVSPCSSLASSPSSSSSSTGFFASGPIFPARWLSPPQLKKPPNPVKWDRTEWNEKWDGKAKNVQEMASEREGLVSLRRSHVFPDNVNKSPVYSEFGFPGRCDNRRSRRNWKGT
ncbi:uncharacterized protein M421DRAFT_93652 [Didymella exigua CBS 183.55]|uniref:Uncharacterized protein n=1 Tax=Didymella exigua CBS 183.55 TaxID=1150837 RepID=A0A6A5REL6_9PLEO|nr:uncharacterized protein M421DRAFT_93652 [Didymella exigua CBS 183.55]KAF1926731.1 hypothetical protein M421DRAFT_93652 [Didymella exigua CBS 183.55]